MWIKLKTTITWIQIKNKGLQGRMICFSAFKINTWSKNTNLNVYFTFIWSCLNITFSNFRKERFRVHVKLHLNVCSMPGSSKFWKNHECCPCRTQNSWYLYHSEVSGFRVKKCLVCTQHACTLTHSKLWRFSACLDSETAKCPASEVLKVEKSRIHHN